MINRIGKMAEVITQFGDEYDVALCVDQWFDEDWEQEVYTFIVATEQHDIPAQGVVGWIEGEEK